MDTYAILSSKPHNPHYLNRYYKFILACKEANEKLIRRSKKNPDGVYMEGHHICPKAKDLFPEYKKFKDHPWNRIDLTYRQHFIAHRILWKVYGGGMAMAFFKMAIIPNSKYNSERTSKINSKTFELIKIDRNAWFSENYSGENHPMFGRKHRESSLHLMSDAHRGVKLSKETCEKMSLAKMGDKNSMHGLGENHPRIGVKDTSETRKKKSIAQRRHGSNHPQSDHTIRNWIHEKYGNFTGTNYELYLKYNEIQNNCISRKYLSAVCKGKYSQHRGWKLF